MTTSIADYPGTAQHQALLQAVVAHYQNDPRVLAVILFGSLARSGDTWDAHSDLDLDVIIADSVKLEPIPELQRLCQSFAALGEKAAVIVPDGDDAGDVLLESLMRLSVRYHPLAQTSPNIVGSMKVLAGSLNQASIVAAGEANRHRRRAAPPLSQLLDQCVYYASIIRVCLWRERTWPTIEFLHRARGLLMEIFSRTHAGERAWNAFEYKADRNLQARLGTMVAHADLPSLCQALEQLLDLLENDLEDFSEGQLHLTEAHRIVIHRIRSSL